VRPSRILPIYKSGTIPYTVVLKEAMAVYKPFNQLKFMLERANSPESVAVVKMKKGEVVYQETDEEFDPDIYVKGNFELNLVNGLVNGKGVKVSYFHGEFYFKLLRGTEELPEVVQIVEMKYHGKAQKFPICLLNGELYPDVNALALKLYGEVNFLTIQQAINWGKDHLRVTRKYSDEPVPFKLRDFELMAYHYSTRGNRSGCAFLHKKLGFISGLGQLSELFPNLTPKQVRSIYHRFSITPSTNITKLFLDKEQTDKVNQLIRELNIHFNPKEGLGYCGEEADDSFFGEGDIKKEPWGKQLSDREVSYLWKTIKAGKSTSKTL